MYGTAQTFALSLERERFTRTEESGDDTLDLLNDCDLLIIDDLGMEISSSYIMSAIYNVIDTRIMLKKPTIISTNLSMLELEKRYTERFVSRVIGFYDRLPFRGKDIRMQKSSIRKTNKISTQAKSRTASELSPPFGFYNLF